MSDTVDNTALCLSSLRDLDKDRYLAVLLSPEDRRRALTALYLYNAELARVRELVHEPLPGEIRLQYWRDLLSGEAHGATEANPVAAELLDAVARYKLPVEPLAAMSEARIFDLYDDPMESTAAFEGYAGETASALLQLAALVVDAEAAATAAETAGHAGVAQAVAGALLLLPDHRARGQVYIPREILGATGLDRDTFLAGDDRPRIRSAIEAFAGYGLDHLARALPAGRRLPDRLTAAYLPLAMVRKVLTSAAANGSRVLAGDIRPSQLRRQIAMAVMLWRRRF